MKIDESLYEITGNMLALEEILDEAEGDITDPEVETAVNDWFTENLEKEKGKLDGYDRLIAKWQARASSRKEEAKRLNMRARAYENRVNWLKDRVLEHLVMTGQKKVEGTLHNFRQQNSAPRLQLDPHVEEHPEELPEQFHRVVFTPDKVAIKNALKAGEELDFARLVQGVHLRID